jgi:hypothetical protein
MIWDVFASRGLGVNASAGDGNIGNDQVEDFTRPAAGASYVLGTSDFENEDIMKVYQTLQMALSMFVSVSIFWDC